MSQTTVVSPTRAPGGGRRRRRAVPARAGRLLADAGFTVTAQAGDARALLGAVRADPPDVVVRRHPDAADAHHRGPGRRRGRCAASHPSIGVLVLSAHVEPPYALRADRVRRRGAGYLLKERVADLDELVDAVRRVAAGGLVVDPSVVAQLVGRPRAHNPLDDLTEREREVLP